MSLRLCRILERVFVHYFADGLYLRIRGPAATQAMAFSNPKILGFFFLRKIALPLGVIL